MWEPIASDSGESTRLRPTQIAVTFDTSAPAIIPTPGDSQIVTEPVSGVAQDNAQPNATPPAPSTALVPLSAGYSVSPQTTTCPGGFRLVDGGTRSARCVPGGSELTIAPTTPQPTPVYQAPADSVQRYYMSHRDPAFITEANPNGWVKVANAGFTMVILPWGAETFVNIANEGAIRAEISRVKAAGSSADLTALNRLLEADARMNPDNSNVGVPLDPTIKLAIEQGWGTNLTPEQLENIRVYGNPGGLSMPGVALPSQTQIQPPSSTVPSGLPTRPQPIELIQTRDPFNPSLPPNTTRPAGTGTGGPGGSANVRTTSAVTVSPTAANTVQPIDPVAVMTQPMTTTTKIAIGVGALFALIMLIRALE